MANALDLPKFDEEQSKTDWSAALAVAAAASLFMREL